MCFDLVMNEIHVATRTVMNQGMWITPREALGAVFLLIGKRNGGKLQMSGELSKAPSLFIIREMCR